MEAAFFIGETMNKRVELCVRDTTAMKPKLFLCLALVLSGGLIASAYMADIPVTPKSLDQGDVIFSVSTNSAQSGTAFHITITAKKGFSPASYIGLSNNGPGVGYVSIQPTNLTPQITVKKDRHSWEVDFIAPDELLKNPKLCFTFSEIPYAIGPDGKNAPVTGGTIYEIKLRDFLKP